MDVDPPGQRFHLRQAYLLLTRRCNLSCSHCIRSSDSSFNQFISTALAERIISQLSAGVSGSVLLLSGGEPALHPQFGEIVELAVARFERVVINTNGLLQKKILALRGLADNLEVQISVDGDRKTHESIRGPDTYDKTLRNIRLISEEGMPVTVATTVSGKNIHSLSRLDDDLKDVPFSRWTLKRMVDYGRAIAGDDVDTQDWNNYVEVVGESYANRHRIRLSRMFSLPVLLSRAAPSSNIELSRVGCNCGTGRSKLYVNPDGTVYPCACMEHLIVGDFNSDDYGVIRERLSQLPILPEAGSICRQCRAWERCQGGCPGASQRSGGLGDSRCPVVARAHGPELVKWIC